MEVWLKFEGLCQRAISPLADKVEPPKPRSRFRDVCSSFEPITIRARDFGSNSASTPRAWEIATRVNDDDLQLQLLGELRSANRIGERRAVRGQPRDLRSNCLSLTRRRVGKSCGGPASAAACRQRASPRHRPDANRKVRSDRRISCRSHALPSPPKSSSLPPRWFGRRGLGGLCRRAGDGR